MYRLGADVVSGEVRAKNGAAAAPGGDPDSLAHVGQLFAFRAVWLLLEDFITGEFWWSGLRCIVENGRRGIWCT